jgi:hypothetical protein
MKDSPELMKEASMLHCAKTFGCAIALMFGIQAAAADPACVNNQRVDNNGQVLQDATGHPVRCDDLGPADGDAWLFGAGALLIGGGIAAELATSASGGGAAQPVETGLGGTGLGGARPASP